MTAPRTIKTIATVGVAFPKKDSRINCIPNFGNINDPIPKIMKKIPPIITYQLLSPNPEDFYGPVRYIPGEKRIFKSSILEP